MPELPHVTAVKIRPGVRSLWRGGALLLVACSPSRGQLGPTPDPGPLGCYVILEVRQTGGETTDFLFPGFFGLDSTPLPNAAVSGRVVLLPHDDLSRRAGSWSWMERNDSIVLTTITPTEGWHLGFTRSGRRWQGRLSGWADSLTVAWTVGGRQVDCPRGLVPAAH